MRKIQLSFPENKDGILSKSGNTTQDYVFLLSEEEFNENMNFDAKTRLSEYAHEKSEETANGLMENSLADSYLEVCRAKNNFDILYGAEFGDNKIF